MRRIDWIIFHCTAGPQTQSIQSILDYWKNVKKWKSPGYHIIVKPDGAAVYLLAIEEVSNGVQGFNAHSINICYIGGVEVIKGVNASGKPIALIGKAIDNRTDAQKETMLRLALHYKKLFPTAGFRGHRDFSIDKNKDGIIQSGEWMKTCPSFSVTEWRKCAGF